MNVGIYIENQKLDLFNDEAISIVASVLSIQDITINTTDYSRAFTVPASDNNNKIFKHYYNTDIDNSFDARKKVTARIEIGGTVFKDGKIMLTKVQMKHGRPSSYMLNFFGMLVSLKDIFGSDKLSVLDYSEFTEPYIPNLIKALLTNNQTPGEIAGSITHRTDLICSLLSNRRYFYSSDSVSYDPLIEVNLDWRGSTLNNGARWNELKTSFKIRSIIEKIESYYGLNFTGGFFDETLFDNLYLCLDNGTAVQQKTNQRVEIDWSPGVYTYIQSDSSVEFDILGAGNYITSCQITPALGYTTVPYTIKQYVNGVLDSEISSKGTISISKTISGISYNYIHYEIEASEYFKYTPIIAINVPVPLVDESATTATANILNVDFVVSQQMPDITVMDFLKGLIQAFKLVIIPVTETDIYINPVVTYYAAGNTIDITQFVDIGQIDINRPTLLNKISYKFKDPLTILNKQFKGTTEQAYGDEMLYVYDDDGDLIDGSTVDIQLPFEQVIYERLVNTYTNTNTNIQYGALIDEKLALVHINPHIHYAILKSLGTWSLAFHNGTTSEELTSSYYAPSHVANDTTFGTGFIFGSEIEEYTKNTITDSLYSVYHQDYINSIFASTIASSCLAKSILFFVPSFAFKGTRINFEVTD